MNISIKNLLFVMLSLSNFVSCIAMSDGGSSLIYRGIKSDNPVLITQGLHFAAGLGIKQETVVNNPNFFKEGQTPLMFAIRSGSVNSGKYLISLGANINAQNGEECTALMISIIEDNEAFVKMLIKEGADLDIETNIGTTAIIWSMRLGLEKYARLLALNGAELTKANKKGKTAIACAREANNLGLCSFFEEFLKEKEEVILKSLSEAHLPNDIDKMILSYAGY